MAAENPAVDNKVGLDGRVNLDMRGHRWESLGSLLAETPDAEIYVPAHPTRSYLSYEDRIRTVLFEVGTRSLGVRNLDHLGGD